MTFAPPYYAVIFVSRRTPTGAADYAATAREMEELAQSMPGYLGIDSARDTTGFGITVSYWKDEESIARWREHATHRLAQDRGRREWYSSFDLHIARVERSRSFTA